jgi:protein ImuA
MVTGAKSGVVTGLQADILRLQGLKVCDNPGVDLGLGPIINSFPNSSFPTGAVHEFISANTEDAAASSGFIAGLLSSLLTNTGAVLWISSSRKLFPPALKNFGIHPDHFIFIDLQKERDVLWTMDEALKCGALSAVVGEMKEISFTNSRRLQLAVEQSGVTGFVLHNKFHSPNTTACVSRWKITPMPSEAFDEMPGICFPKWRVELMRIKNGKPGAWEIQWMYRKFVHVQQFLNSQQQRKKTG